MSSPRSRAIPALGVLLILGVLAFAVPRGCGYDLVPTQHINTPGYSDSGHNPR